jgi:hypothetical protein
MNISAKEGGKKHTIDSLISNNDNKRPKTENIFTEETINNLFKEKKIDEIVESISKIKNLDLHTKVYEKLSMFLRNSKDNTEKFVAANGIKVVVATMNHYIASGLCDNLVMYVFNIFMTYAYYYKASAKLLTDGAIKAFICAMNAHMTSTVVLNNACDTLDYFAQIREGSATILVKPIIDEGGIAILINIIKTHKQNFQLTSKSLKTLVYLIIDSDSRKINNYTKDVVEEVIEPVVKAMYMVDSINKRQFTYTKHDALILLNGYKLVNILAEQKNIAEKLASKTDFVSNIYDMITKNVVHISLLVSALPVLLKLVVASQEQKKHQYATFYYKLCHSIIQYKDEDMVYHSCVLLRIFSAFIPNEKQNIAIEYINMLLEPMKRYINNDRILLEALLTIKNCTKINSSSQMYQTGVISVLLDDINKHMNKAELNNSAYCAIVSLLEQSRNVDFNDRILSFVASGGIKTVVASMKTFAVKNEPGDELNIICKLLYILCNSPTNYGLIVELQGFKELLAIIKKYIKHKNMPVYLDALARIYCSPHSGINKDVVSFDDIKTIVEVMIEHNDKPNVQYTACEILRVWTFKDIPVTGLTVADFRRIQMFDKLNPNYKTIADAGGFTAVITAMTKYEDNNIVQSYAFSMLVNYVKRVGRSAIDQVMTELDLLIKNMNMHIDNVQVRYYACALLGHLCLDFDINKVPQVIIIKENQTAIIKKECIKYAIAVLEKEIEKGNNIVNPCFLLFNIAENNNNNSNSIKDFFGCNIMDTILSVVKKNRNNVKNLIRATWLLPSLVQYNDGPDKFAMAGGIGLILDIMITHKKEKVLIINILVLLFKVSQVENYLLNIASTCGIGPLLTTMQEIVEDSSDKILLNVCKIMNNLVKVEQIKDAMKELKVSEWAKKVKDNKSNTDTETNTLLDALINLD